MPPFYMPPVTPIMLPPGLFRPSPPPTMPAPSQPSSSPPASSTSCPPADAELQVAGEARRRVGRVALGDRMHVAQADGAGAFTALFVMSHAERNARDEFVEVSLQE